MSDAKKERCSLSDLLSRVRNIREKDDPPFESQRFTEGPPTTETGQGGPWKRLKWRSHFGTDSYYRQMERADWQHVDMWLAHWSAKFITAAQQMDVPLFVHGAFRTKEEQNSLQQLGRSQLVWPKAPHCQGAAVDIVHARYAWDLSEDEWAWLGYLGLETAYKLNSSLPKSDRLELEWGGSWTGFYDPAHWEIKDWRDRVLDLSAGEPVRRTTHANLKLPKAYPTLAGRMLPTAPPTARF